MRFLLAFFSVVPFAFFILIAPEVGAQTCGTGTCTNTPTIEQFCLVGNGFLEQVAQCTVFQAGISGFGIRATLSNYGGFSVGDEVHVEGCAEAIDFSACFIGYHIRDNTIELPEPDALTTLGSGITMLALLYRRRMCGIVTHRW